MSFMDIVTNVVTGGAYGALTGNWGPETHATAPPPSTPSPTGNFGIFRPVSPPPREATLLRPVSVQQRLSNRWSNRSSLFDESKKVFIEVPRKPAEEKLPLIKAVWEAQVQAVRKQYEAHLIDTLSPEFHDGAIKISKSAF